NETPEEEKEPYYFFDNDTMNKKMQLVIDELEKIKTQLDDLTSYEGDKLLQEYDGIKQRFDDVKKLLDDVKQAIDISSMNKTTLKYEVDNYKKLMDDLKKVIDGYKKDADNSATAIEDIKAEIDGVIEAIGGGSFEVSVVSDKNEENNSTTTITPSSNEVVTINLGEQHKITTFQGAIKINTMQIVLVNNAEVNNTNYSYQIINAPDGMSISDEGVFKYVVPQNEPQGTKSIAITVTDKNTLVSKTITLEILILESEVVLFGTLGEEGGTLSNDETNTTLEIPVGAVSEASEFIVYKSINIDGSCIYRTSSSVPLQKLLILRKPECSNTNTSSLRKFRQRETINGWQKWDEDPWNADYVQVNTTDIAVDPINRLRTVRDGNPQGHGIEIHFNKEASTLFSLCGTESSYECQDKEPVLFVHGFLTGPSTVTDETGSPFGGGSGTWGSLPELMRDEGYAVFEFTWKTNARFKDVAVDLAQAIKKIQDASAKKVHIIAHSFGGLLARTYIQNLAINTSYANNVHSLLTLSTPHSGIFDSSGMYHGINFAKGQDSGSFEGCMQSSCHQAGEPTPKIWNALTWDVDLNFPLPARLEPHYLDISEYLGINKNTGELPALLAQDIASNGFPVNTRVLMALTIDRKVFADNNREDYQKDIDDLDLSELDIYQQGDELISYAGQRFLFSLKNSVTSDTPIYEHEGISITEKILGAPHGTLPNSIVLTNEAINDKDEKINFEGYRHSHTSVG
ncbi:MAG: hypothetical protein U9N49_05410, partial [Campylobacterota bacterium]|nr:hypothetical protein [Campylobacterota bacterium]